MKRFIKNDRGEYAAFDMDANKWTWVPHRSSGQEFSTRHLAWRIRAAIGGKVYRLRKPSVKRERRQAVGYLRALGGTRMYQAYNAALSAAAGGIERGEHLAWRQPKEAK